MCLHRIHVCPICGGRTSGDDVQHCEPWKEIQRLYQELEADFRSYPSDAATREGILDKARMDVCLQRQEEEVESSAYCLCQLDGNDLLDIDAFLASTSATEFGSDTGGCFDQHSLATEPRPLDLFSTDDALNSLAQLPASRWQPMSETLPPRTTLDELPLSDIASQSLSATLPAVATPGSSTGIYETLGPGSFTNTGVTNLVSAENLDVARMNACPQRQAGEIVSSAPCNTTYQTQKLSEVPEKGEQCRQRRNRGSRRTLAGSRKRLHPAIIPGFKPNGSSLG